MRVAVDTHVHLYPFYDPARLFAAACRNLSGLCSGVESRAICLTEREGQTYFKDLASGKGLPAGWRLAESGDNYLVVASDSGERLTLFAGRQFIAAERIEVLALGVDLIIKDGLPAAELLPRIREAGGLPVLPWGLGKWLGARGTLICRLLERAKPGDFALADTCLMPSLLPRPALLRAASERGFRVLAGTDPLPRAGEESRVGRYGVVLEAPPGATALLVALADPAVLLQTAGTRDNPLEFISRCR